MPGCAERTTLSYEFMRNAKQKNRQITVCWTDLENAFGSIRHDLIQFALSWYHFPLCFRELVHDYYDGLCIKIRTKKWTTEPISVLKGIFQGCPLSAQLFNMTWNIALDMIEALPVKGYKLKEADIEQKQLAYVDDHTTTTANPGEAQKILNTLDKYFVWSKCMKAKPNKCRAVGFKVFQKNEEYTPVTSTTYSAYNPNLVISDQPVPFLGNESFKFLGRKISVTKNNVRSEIKNELVQYLRITSKAKITGAMKMWLYYNYIVPHITWQFTIYDFPVSYGEELKEIATKHLKEWTGLTRTITTSVLYRSKDHFGLGLTDLTTHLKKMQVCRMHIHKYSQDTVSRKLYEYIKDRDKAPKNGLGIPMKSKIWKPANALEETERNIYLDKIAFGQSKKQNKQKGLILDRHITLKRIEADDEESRMAKCYNYLMQGDWLNFDAVLEADLSWKALIYALPHELFKFLINSTHNVLPTPDNLKRWGKTVVDIKCSLCGSVNATLKHILNGCPMALNQGRFTWRHDNILQYLAKELQPKIEQINSSNKPNKNIKDSFIKFVKEGKRAAKEKSTYKPGLLYTANDWILIYDKSQDPLIFPPHIVQTSLRPDLIIYSNTTRQVILIELTVPTEDNIIDWHVKKEEKYSKLLDDIGINKWNGHIFGIEVGSRGYVAKSVVSTLKKLGLEQSFIKNVKNSISLICLRSSYVIYLSRKNVTWRPWEDKTHTNTKSTCSSSKMSMLDHSSDHDFTGFTKPETYRAKIINEKKISSLKGACDVNIGEKNNFIGFTSSEINRAKTINAKKVSILQRWQKLNNITTFSSNKTYKKMPFEKESAAADKCKKNLPSKHSKCTTITGITNLGNTCYMNSVMQCLNSLTPLVTYFEGNTYLGDIHPDSKYNGILAKEVSAAFKIMNSRGRPISLLSLKELIGNLYNPFVGFGQEDAHEFLIKLLELMYEDLGREKISTLHGTPDDVPNGQIDVGVPKILEILQGMHKITVLCKSCHYTSSSFEPFNVLSLSPPTTKTSNVEKLLKCAYGDNHISYTCPGCRKQDSSRQKHEIVKLPQVLILHLKRFDVNNKGISKNQQYVDFPLEKLNVGESQHAYKLSGITNHYGTLHAGHYISFCKSRSDGGWYKCDDSKITKLDASIKTSAAYLLYYELFHS